MAFKSKEDYLHFRDQLSRKFDIDKIVHTIRLEAIKPNRRCGNTTRQVNIAIEQLFLGNVVVCLDHHLFGGNQRYNEDLLFKVIDRLTDEHNLKYKLDFNFERDKTYIYLKDRKG